MIVLRYLLLIFLGFPLWLQAATTTLSGTVASVYDGDTLTLKDSMGTDHKIRFEHIDAPEVNPSQFYGITARDALRALVLNKSVTVQVSGKDRYGRNLGVVNLGQTNINLEMVAKGHAWHYKAYSKLQQYATAETQARQAKIGLWAQSNPIPPWDFRNGVRPQQQGGTQQQGNTKINSTYLPGTPINGANPNPILTNIHKRQLRLGLRKGVKLPASMIPVKKGTPPPKSTGLTLTKQTKVTYYRPVLFQGSNKKPVKSISGRARRPR